MEKLSYLEVKKSPKRYYHTTGGKWTHKGGVMLDKKASCRNCNKAFRHTWKNNGYICVGIVKDTYRDCDILRTCQYNPTTKEKYLEDRTPDEVSMCLVAQQVLLQEYFRFFYKRPCTKECEKENKCGIIKEA